MAKPLVSVLIPCFNAERYIADTLDSVLRQTWPEIEIIVVNDGSTDGSARVVTRFPSVKLLNQPNAGQTVALNKALSHARGDFVQYLDADDLISENKIEVQLRRLVDSPRCVASCAWGRFWKSPDETRFLSESVWRDMDPVDWLVESRAGGGGMMLPALWLLPRTLIDGIGPWREDLSLNNDAEYFTRALLLCDHVLFCEGARCYYRSGIHGSLSGRKSPKAWKSQFIVIELCEERIMAREDSERVRRGFALSWQHLAHACYPYDRTLARRALARASSLHTVQIRPDGGATFHLISRLLGWKVARLLQVASGRP